MAVDKRLRELLTLFVVELKIRNILLSEKSEKTIKDVD
ncbi:hypothetical protein LCGC14_1427660 [marine sediment metagenome]|uniref:Uncharacterized protein n=1 Tax=marine sediment metagenome TaxID=412755 RepID=A0A0F9JPI1_9ZZZZ